MTLPEHFQLYGQTINVKPAVDLIQEDDSRGQADYRTNTITLQVSTPTWTMERAQVEQAFCHELTHFILEKMDHKLFRDEVFVNQFSYLLHQALTTFEGDLHV